MQNPFRERREHFGKWKRYAHIDMEAQDDILDFAGSLNRQGFKKFDALHLACAITANADYFLTTDNGILKKAEMIKHIHIKDPIDFIRGA